MVMALLVGILVSALITESAFIATLIDKRLWGVVYLLVKCAVVFLLFFLLMEGR